MKKYLRERYFNFLLLAPVVYLVSREDGNALTYGILTIINMILVDVYFYRYMQTLRRWRDREKQFKNYMDVTDRMIDSYDHMILNALPQDLLMIQNGVKVARNERIAFRAEYEK